MPADITLQLYNHGFDSLEFEGTRNEAERNSFFLSAKKWIVATGAMQMRSLLGMDALKQLAGSDTKRRIAK